MKIAAVAECACIALVLLIAGPASAPGQVAPHTPRVEQLRQVERLTGIVRDTSDHKCGFRWMASVATRASSLPAAAAEEVRSAMAPVALSDIVVGHFRIYYDSTGADAPSLLDAFNQRIPGTALAFVDSVARIFNEVWTEEVDRLGYDAPPLSAGSYPVYIYDFGNTFYGQTVFEGSQLNPGIVPPRYATHIEVDNDFRDFLTKGMAGLRVTAAHEFHHAIQVGSYGYWDDQRFAMELTSTWMESHVYPAIHDYLQYLPDFFGSGVKPGISAGLSLGDETMDGYERCIWGIYLEQQHGPLTMTEVWRQMRSVRFIAASDRALARQGTSMANACALFSYWNYFTADRADPSQSYLNGALYPRYRRVAVVPFMGGAATASADVASLSTTMFDFLVQTDTVTIIASETDTEGAVAIPMLADHVAVAIATGYPGMPRRVLANGLSVGMRADDLSRWRSYVLSSSTRTDVPLRPGDPFPNPFRLQTDEVLVLPVAEKAGNEADVSILTSALGRIHGAKYAVSDLHGSTGIRIPASELRGKSGTGLHFVAAHIGDHDYLWKVVLIP